MRCGGGLLIFDAGSGLRELGRELMKGGAVEGDLFLSHTHYDHLMGLPFFMSAFQASNRFHVWAGHLLPENTIEQVLRKFMAEPLFPVPLDIFNCTMIFQDFRAGETLTPRPGVEV